jgi:hypothetical protein
MRSYKFLVLVATFAFITLFAYGQVTPGDIGFPGGGGGGAVPLDGGILLALLAAGGFGASLFAKSKKKDK